jgi:hypothetical protein
MRRQKVEKPSINVYFSKSIDISSYSELIWGIEEEGIPHLLKQKEEKSGIKLSFNAARESRLGVGIGIGDDGYIALHYTKLEPESPLFKISSKECSSRIRAVGANSARLVKGIPFKDLDTENDDLNRQPREKDEIDISEIAAKVLERFKLET